MNTDQLIAERHAAFEEELKRFYLDYGHKDSSPIIDASLQRRMLAGYDELVQALQELPFDPANLREHDVQVRHGEVDVSRRMTRGFYARAVTAAEIYNFVLQSPHLREYAQNFCADPQKGVKEEELLPALAQGLTRSVVGKAIETGISAGFLSKKYYGIVHPIATMEFALLMRTAGPNKGMQTLGS